MKCLFFGTSNPNELCASYIRAAIQLGIETHLYDYEKHFLTGQLVGKIKYKLHQHITNENWNHTINRDFVVFARSYKPDFVFSFTNAPLTAGAISFLRSILTNCKFVLIWPDSILNIKQLTLGCLPLYDLIASYGLASVKPFEILSGTSVQFIPLAGDLEIHGLNPVPNHSVEIGFVGGWRPERQHILERINIHFPDLEIKIYGPRWKERCNKSRLRYFINDSILQGKLMADFFNRTRINLNIIDDTNFPSANMRFFEILAAGGLQLVSECPEMESIFIEGKDVLYFENDKSLFDKIAWIIKNQNEAYQIKLNGNLKLRNGHCYSHRLKAIIEELQGPK